MQEKARDELSRLESWELTDLRTLRDNLDLLIHRKKSEEPLYSILDFEGIGHGTWRDVGGVDEFLKQERASWGSENEEVVARLLSPEDQARLAEEITVELRQHLESSQPRRSVLEFEGMDQESWKDVDVEEYLKQERGSLDKDNN